MSAAGTPMMQPRFTAPVSALLQLGLRIGLAKPIARRFLGRINSEERHAKAFAGYVPTAHDVFVATYAKSGTNWMMQIAHQIAHRGDAEFDHIHQFVPWPDSPMPMPTPLEDPAALAGSPTGLRVIKTHLAPRFVPYDESALYVTVIRDPKEVVVSSYHFLLGIMGATPYVSPAEWFELVARPEGLIGGWVEHTAGFWSWRDRDNVLVLTYPELKREPERFIARVAELMRVELTPAQLARVVERSSFAWMKENESKFSPPRLPFVKEAATMIRRGESDASDEMLTPEQMARVDEMSRKGLAQRGSDLPYEVFEARE